MKILVIDNYDSFTYNLYQLVGQILEETGKKFSLDVFRNDEISISQIKKSGYEKIIISPGPGDPSDKSYFGVCADVLTELGKVIPVLGVCLGMQGLGHYYGGKVSRAKKVMHGKTSIITHTGKGLFKGLPQDLEVMRYHSLIVEKENLPEDLEILATSEDGEIMGLQHKKYPISGVQFHPESFATEGGKRIMENFLFGLEKEMAFMTDLHGYLKLLIERKDLNQQQAEDLLGQLTDGSASAEMIAAILTALASKGESIDEIVGFAQGMRELMLSINSPRDSIDIVGTGGDGSNSFNISTVSAIVTAACGVPMAKHGNRSASSKCGSADVLEALGVNINLTPEKAEKVLKKVGMVFLFAPMFHPAMKTVGPARRELKIRTIFNYLGPFLNPGKVNRMLLGVANLELAEKFLEIARKLNFEHLFIVTSNDGLDEISIADKTTAFELKNGDAKKFIIDPLKLGFPKYSKSEIDGGEAKLNAQIAKDILSGKETGAKKDAIILNSAYGLLVAGKVKNVKDGIQLAAEAINSGKALRTLEDLIKETKNNI